MKRCVDDLCGRSENLSGVCSGVTGSVGTVPGGIGIGGGGVCASALPGVRGPSAITASSSSLIVRSPSVLGHTVTPVIPNNPVPGVATVEHNPSNPVSQTGYSSYVNNKVEMHTGVHHPVTAYSTGVPMVTAPQGNFSNVDGGRTLMGGLIAPTAPPTSVIAGTAAPNAPSVLQHVNTAHPHVRHKVNVAGVGNAGMVHAGPSGVSISGNAASASTNPQNAGQFQRLKVEDALTYLDKVKHRFGRQPQVYNDFLDIMKEFKSQSIDTPGVIARVSQLFGGHPELIVGFNTFLPPGYKIEVSVAIQGQQTTVVHTPEGVHHVTQAHQGVSVPTPAVKIPLQTTSNNAFSVGLEKSIATNPVSHSGGGWSVTQKGSNTNCRNVTVNTTPLGNQVSHGLIGSSETPSAPLNDVTPSAVCTTHDTSLNTSMQVTTAASSSMFSNSVNLTTTAPHSTNTAPHHGSSAREIHSAVLSQPLNVQHPLPAQPVEFKQAITYVNKIKHRFQGQPEIYNQFLEILHTYKKEQKHIKDGGTQVTHTLTEEEVYEKVAKLFENQEDLLQEFSQFLPDATNSTAAQAAMSDIVDQFRSYHGTNKNVASDHISTKKPLVKSGSAIPAQSNSVSGAPVVPSAQSKSPMFGHPVKRSHSSTSGTGQNHSQQPPVKKLKLGFLKDMSTAEAGKYATLAEYAFFDKVRKALRYESTYHNFLRCITLFNEEIIARFELVQMVTPYLAKFPDLLKWFKDFVGYRDGPLPTSDIISQSVAKQERISGDLAMEIDYTTCKRLGASYCALPKSYPQPKCSGRSNLCKEVLNDTWVSFPSWSEDSTFVTSKKTQYEEYIYRCEDERFELDVVLETNLTTMRILEGVQKKLQRMNPEEAARFKLDDTLGGQSPTIHQRAIRRIYGEKSADIIDGLKKNPVIAVPLVLRRLKAKDDEWREAQKGFNKIWREQNEKYYLKSLDHQGITFKQNDTKTLRSKSLLNDIEALFDERHEQAEEGTEVACGPHMVLEYKDRSILDDAANLLIHHIKRQSTTHKEDKARMKQLVRQFIPDLFFHPRQELSDDEKDLDDEEFYMEEEEEKKVAVKNEKAESNGRMSRDRECKQSSGGNSASGSKRKTRSHGNDVDKENDIGKGSKDFIKEDNQGKVTLNGDATEEEKSSLSLLVEVSKEEDVKQEPKSDLSCVDGSLNSDDEYRLFMGNNNWYLFFRLHNILCRRLTTMFSHAQKLAEEEILERKERKESTAVALRLKPKNEIPVEEYYPALLDMVKNVLDGNLEPTAFEDTLREMFGIVAYPAFTMDRVVSGTVRQLQHLVTDDISIQCTSLYLSEAKRGGAGGPCASAARRVHSEHAYQKRSEKSLHDENCFRFQTYKRTCQLTIELVDTEIEGDESGSNSDPHLCTVRNSPNSHAGVSNSATEFERWSSYVEKYVTSMSVQLSPSLQAQLRKKPVFLPRNVRSSRKITAHSSESDRFLNNSTGVEADDNTQCKFHPSNYKMVFVVNSESYMHRRQALKRARQSHEAVSLRMHKGLLQWHSAWCSKHVTEMCHHCTKNWFMGSVDGLRPNRTVVVPQDYKGRPPFVPYNKYKCEMLDGS